MRNGVRNTTNSMNDDKENKIRSRLEDGELVKKTLSGDKEAFTCLINKYYRMFYRLCMGYLKNHEEVQDVVQEGVIQIYHSLKSLEDPLKFGSWSYTVIRRQCIELIRSREREKRGMTKYTDIEKMKSIQEQAELKSELSMEHQKQRDCITEAVYQLPKLYQEVAILYFLEGLDSHQIGELLDISAHAAEMRLHRAKAILRDLLKGIL